PEHLRVGDLPAPGEQADTGVGIGDQGFLVDAVAVLEGIAVEEDIAPHQARIDSDECVDATDSAVAGRTARAMAARGAVIAAGAYRGGAEVVGQVPADAV